MLRQIKTTPIRDMNFSLFDFQASEFGLNVRRRPEARLRPRRDFQAFCTSSQAAAHAFSKSPSRTAFLMKRIGR
jgi:hypothetical protein